MSTKFEPVTLENIKQRFRAQSLPDFMGRKLPPKEPLIEGLLYRRDSVALVARRRHGKTTLASHAAVAMAGGENDFIGYQIPAACNVVFYYLEDDPTEIQEKLSKQLGGNAPPPGFHLYTRRDLLVLGIVPEATNPVFQRHVELACEKVEADALFLDNLGHLIGADYNNSNKVHELVKLIYRLQERHNIAVVTLAHPRKVNGKFIVPVSLVDNPEQFFEECMGTSHFINSVGSLWGLQRDATDRTYFVGGAQRYEGSQAATELQKDDNDRFQVATNMEENRRLALNTPAREQAWGLLPDDREFSFTEFLDLIKPAMSSRSAANKWLRDSLLRLGLVRRTDSGNYRKLSAPTNVAAPTTELPLPEGQDATGSAGTPTVAGSEVQV